MYYPIYLDLKGRFVLVVGGGKVGERKVLALVEAGAEVTVVSPELTDVLAKMAKEGSFSHKKSSYVEGDLEGFDLCFSAINSAKTTEKVAKEAKKRQIWLNAADVPEHCDFILPSVVDRGDLKIAISTGGKSPMTARKMREKLEVIIGDEYEVAVKILGAIRYELLKNNGKSVIKLDGYKVFAEEIIGGDDGFLDLVRTKDKTAIDKILTEKFGENFTLEKLAVKF